jgi:hypothetical protein
MAKIYGAISIAGATGSLKAIDGAILNDTDLCYLVDNGAPRTYSLDADSGLAENSPYVVAPTTNPGQKRWILQSASYEIDALSEYGSGVTFTQATIEAALTAIGTTKCTLLLRPGNWVILTALAFPANVTVDMPSGAYFSGAAVTAGTITFANTSQVVIPEMFGLNTIPGTTNMAAAINAAIQSTDQPIMLAGGTYLVTPDIHVTISGADVHSCFKVKDNMHLRGIPGKTALKIADHVSTDAAPLLHYYFVSDAVNTDISFDGIMFDFNGAENPISPARPAAYNTYHQAAMYWGGATGKVDNLTVNNCVFKTSPGSNPVCMGDGPLSENIKITNNQFIDNGWDTSDHTTVLIYGKNVEVSGNIFTLPTLAVIRQVAIDVHGPYCDVHDNYVQGYVVGVGVTQNEDLDDYHSIDVHDNLLNVNYQGIWVFRGLSGAHALYNVSIHDNIIELNDWLDNFSQDPAGIYIMPDLDISKIYIYDNIIAKLGGVVYVSYGINIIPTTTSDISELFIESNHIDCFTEGIVFTDIAGTGNVIDLHILNNTITNCITSTTPVKDGRGIFIKPVAGQEVTVLYLVGNTITNSDAEGVYLGGTIGIIHYKSNTLSGNTPDYAETSLTNTHYYGEPGIILLAETNVALNATPTVILYTVPSYRTLIISHATITVGADAGASVVSIGSEGGSYVNFIPNNTLTNLNAANAVGVLMPIPSTTPLKQIVHAGAAVVKMLVTTGAGGATNTVRLYGSLY